MPPDARPRFGFDQNFPHPIVLNVVKRWTAELDLVPLNDIDPRLTKDLGDHRVIQGLWQLGFQGLVTRDDSMLWLPEVVSMIRQTRSSVVACKDSGHDALKASGLLLTQLQSVAKRHDPSKPQIWTLNVVERGLLRFAEHEAKVEARSGSKIGSLRLSQSELRRPVLV